jgi:hypothetical protein
MPRSSIIIILNDLFNDSVRSSDFNNATHGVMINGKWIVKDVEGSGRGLIWGVAAFAWREWEIHEEWHSDYSVYMPRFEQTTSRILFRSFAALASLLILGVDRLLEAVTESGFVRSYQNLVLQMVSLTRRSVVKDDWLGGSPELTPWP